MDDKQNKKQSVATKGMQKKINMIVEGAKLDTKAAAAADFICLIDVY